MSALGGGRAAAELANNATPKTRMLTRFMRSPTGTHFAQVGRITRCTKMQTRRRDTVEHTVIRADADSIKLCCLCLSSDAFKIDECVSREAQSRGHIHFARNCQFMVGAKSHEAALAGKPCNQP